MTHQATIAAALREFCGCTEPAANDYAATILDRLNLPDWHDRPTGPGLWVIKWLGGISVRTIKEGESDMTWTYGPDARFYPIPLDTEGAK